MNFIGFSKPVLKKRMGFFIIENRYFIQLAALFNFEQITYKFYTHLICGSKTE